jgi:nucleoid-associated protein YgaU
VHNATTKQRLSALRRRFGIWTTLPRWARARRDRAEAPDEAEPVGTGQILTAALEPERVETGQLLTAPVEPEPVGTGQILPATVEPERGETGQVLAAGAEPVEPDPALARTVALTDPAAALPPAVPVVQPTPPISDLAGGEPRAPGPAAATRRRKRGIAAGVLAGLVLVLLAFLALVPWLRGPGPEVPGPAAVATPSHQPSSNPPLPASRGEGGGRGSPPLRGGEGEVGGGAPSPRPSTPLRAGGEEAVAAAPAPAGVVEVRPGDTLWDLAAAHLGDPLKWPLLHQANRGIVSDPDLIYPGQSLRIPPG